MSKRDFYEILGVEKSADDTALRKAYRKVAMKYHPDRNPGDKEAEEKFKEAAEAYEILKDPDKRARYDRFGHAGVDPNSGYGGGGFGGGGMTMEDIFSQFGDVFGDRGGPFSDFFGGGGRRSSTPRGEKGSNLRIKVSLTLEEIASGVTKKIKVKKYNNCGTCNGTGAKDEKSVQTCTTCNGSGYVRQVRSTILGQMQTTAVCPTCSGAGTTITAKCGTCKGEGRVYGEETISIDIPAGVSEGMQLSMRGKGNQGKRGGAAGDLLILIEEKPHEQFERDGQSLIYDLHVNFADMALGASIEVPTIDGKVKIKIPAGTQSGKIFRLKGKGLPSVNAYGKGDQLIHVNAWTPKNLNSEEKELLNRLKEMPNFAPNPDKTTKSFMGRMRDLFT